MRRSRPSTVSASTRAQSTRSPSATDSASRASAPWRSAFNVHLLGEPQEGTRHRHAGSVGGRSIVRNRNLLITLLHLDPRDDQLTFLGPQTLQRGLVVLHRLDTNDFFQRRC